MSEEKKTIELNDEELEKVSGGFRITEFSIDAGDCFEDESCIYKALNDVPITNNHTIYINFYCYSKSKDKYSEDSRNAFFIVNSTTYIGKDVI